jgi:hypothetical protein
MAEPLDNAKEGSTTGETDARLVTAMRPFAALFVDQIRAVGRAGPGRMACGRGPRSHRECFEHVRQVCAAWARGQGGGILAALRGLPDMRQARGR